MQVDVKENSSNNAPKLKRAKKKETVEEELQSGICSLTNRHSK
jgi:hypothetical protein